MSLMGSTFSILQLLPDRQRVAQDVAQQVAAVLHSPRAVLYVRDAKHGQLTPVASSRLEERDCLAGVEAPLHLRRWFENQRCRDSASVRRHFEPEVIEENDAQFPASVRVPMTAYGELIGVASASLTEIGAELSARQATILSALGTIGATALRTCGVFAQQEEHWVGLIQALCRAIHSNDAFKQSHARQVADIAVIVARAMGQQDRDALQLIRVAGLVHDVGKIGLPTYLFKKKGRLRAGERAQMQEHCRIGAELLAAVPQLERLADIVLRHHEHFDGGGYPGGLAGSEIPIESRIIAVADAYDAMTHDRPFRAALPHAEAIRRIREGAMSQFDPSVVTVFLELFESESRRDRLLAANFHEIASWSSSIKIPAPEFAQR
jgi:putative nucleotidyltransferase with HDIG domain